MVWRAAGDTSDPSNATVIHSEVVYAVAIILEILYTVFIFGTKPPQLRREYTGYFVDENTYNIERAKRVIGCRPVVRTEEVLK